MLGGAATAVRYSVLYAQSCISKAVSERLRSPDLQALPSRIHDGLQQSAQDTVVTRDYFNRQSV